MPDRLYSMVLGNHVFKNILVPQNEIVIERSLSFYKEYSKSPDEHKM